LGHDLADLLGEFRVACGAESDVVREDRRAPQFAVAMHGIDTVHERNSKVRAQGLHLEAIDCIGPAVGSIGIHGIIAAVEDRTEKQLSHFGALQSDARGLGHLANLLGQAHLAQQLFDVGRGNAGCAHRRGNERRRRNRPLVRHPTTAGAGKYAQGEQRGERESERGSKVGKKRRVSR
jgi:hypothetical protein